MQCALEACRILDRNGVLRQANHEPRKRKVESSSDDDDEFYDRTAAAEEKRARKAGIEESGALSYEQLVYILYLYSVIFHVIFMYHFFFLLITI